MSSFAKPDTGMDGYYAGIVSRFIAFMIDIVVIAAVFTLGGAIVEFVVGVLLHHPVVLSDARLVPKIALAIWVLVYFAYPIAVSGRTMGMGVVGLRVVRADGSDLGAWRSVLRVLALPFSFLLLGLGFALIVLRADRRALQDLIAGSAVVYAWDARAAHLRFLARSSTRSTHRMPAGPVTRPSHSDPS